MELEIQLDDESTKKLLYIQQETAEDASEVIRLSIAMRYQHLQQKETDPLAKLKQSSFIGSFQAETDLAANSEVILRSLTQEKHDHR
jgi:hypothetical protein